MRRPFLPSRSWTRPALVGLLPFALLFGGCEGSGPGTDGAASPAASPEGPGSEAGASADAAELEPRARAEGSGEPPLVLFVGTSLTEGFGLDVPAREAWPARVEELARADGIRLRVRNAGLSGETSAGALRRADWILDPADPPAVIVLETGANDGLRALPVAEMEANLDAIVAAARARFPEVRLVVAGMEAPPNLGADYADAFREVFPRVAERWNAEFVPFLLDGVAGEPELNLPDRIHPTPEGHRLMARNAWPAIRRALGGGG